MTASETATSLITHDLADCEILTAQNPQWCLECTYNIPIGERYYQHRLPQSERANLCLTCHAYWASVVYAADVRAHLLFVELGHLKETVEGLIHLPKFRAAKELFSRILARLSEEATKKSSETSPPDALRERVTEEIAHLPRLSQRFLKERPRLVEEDPSQKKADTGPDFRDMGLGGVIVAFEADIRLAQRGFEQLCFNRSKAQRELCRRRREALSELVEHVQTLIFEEGSFERTAWGQLFYRIQSDLDPSNESTPESFDDTEGWLNWAKNFIKRNQSLAT